MSKAEKIKAKIERLKESLPWGSCASQISMECNCKNEAYNEVLSYINSLEEEPVSNDLEEAATKHARKQLSNPDYPTYNDEYEMECAFEAGAQWQKERDQSTIELAEDHAMLAGMEKMRQEMMKDAVEAQYQGFQLFLGQTFVLWNYKELPFEAGDKVKLVIIKEE